MQATLKQNPRLRDYIPMVFATLFWSMPTLFIRYIRHETNNQFTPEAMNVFRYGAGSLFCFAVVAFWRPRDLLPVLKKIWIPLVLAFSLASFQAVWVPGVCRVSAPFSTLVGRSTLVFNLLFVYILFRDERPLIRSPRFILLSLVCLAAITGIILADPAFTLQATGSSDYTVGTTLLIGAAILWSIYTVSVRRFARGLPSAATFAVTCLFCTLFLIPLAWANHSIGFIASPACPARVIMAIIASGILCIASTQMLFFASLKRIGVLRSSLISLLTPFLTGVLSVVTLGEKLTPVQWLLGALLLTGLAFIIMSTSAGHRLEEDKAPEPLPETPNPAG